VGPETPVHSEHILPTPLVRRVQDDGIYTAAGGLTPEPPAGARALTQMRLPPFS
jgi:hypothetical protein